MTVSDSKVIFSSLPLTLQDIKQVHDAAYIEILACGRLAENKMPRIGFPWSEALMQGSLISAAVQC